MAPTHLLIDLAGVLAGFDRAPRIAALARLSGLAEERVDDLLYGSGFVDAADEGSFDAAGARREIAGRLGLATPDEVDATWMAAFAEDAAVLSVLDSLVPSARVGLLSNNDALVGSLIPRFLPGVAARCSAVVVSGVTGVRKPARGAFAAGLAALAAAPADCVFVDDSASNVDGGRAAGIDSLLHTGPVALAAELARRGLIADRT